MGRRALRSSRGATCRACLVAALHSCGRPGTLLGVTRRARWCLLRPIPGLRWLSYPYQSCAPSGRRSAVLATIGASNEPDAHDTWRRRAAHRDRGLRAQLVLALAQLARVHARFAPVHARLAPDQAQLARGLDLGAVDGHVLLLVAGADRNQP